MWFVSVLLLIYGYLQGTYIHAKASRENKWQEKKQSAQIKLYQFLNTKYSNDITKLR